MPYGTAIDAAGNIYVTGETASPDFPPGANPQTKADRDVFVTKLAPDGTTLLYTTVLSSSGNDSGRAIAVDEAGYAYVAGATSGPGFPVTAGAVRALHGGLEDAFAARLDPQGRLLYSTYLGDSKTDVATAVATRGGDIYMAGYTGSSRFPTSAGAPQRQFREGFYDAFLARLNPQTGVLAYSTFFGGAGNDVARAVAISGSGEACITGRTDSSGLPVLKALSITRAGGGDAFLACLNDSGTAWTQVSYLGGVSEDEAGAIALDAAGNRHIAGSTFSPDFPTTAGAQQRTAGGDYDAFVTVISPSGALVESTFLGGARADSATGLALDETCREWVAGFTNSANFPVSDSASRPAGNFDAFVCRRIAAGRFDFCRYLGGPGDDRGYAIASRGSVVAMAGMTGSTAFVSPAESAKVSQAPFNAFLARVTSAQPLSVAGVAPGSSIGSVRTFNVSIAGAEGVEAAPWILFLLDRALTGVSACYVAYNRGSNRFYLVADTGAVWLSPVTAGTASTVTNSQCTLHAASSKAAVSEGNVVLTVGLSFTAAFAGPKNMYALAWDRQWQSTGWYNAGPWTVPPP